MASIGTKEYDDSIHELEVGLRQLKVLYDQFFAGALDREPLPLRGRLEKIMDHLNRNPPDKLATRFRYNAVLGRFNSFAELWSKMLRTHEEGGRRSISVAERWGIRERLLTRCVISDDKGANHDLLRLHQRYVEARKRHGRAGIPFEKFTRSVGAQVQRLRDEHRCVQIEVRLIERGDKIEIRARPGSKAARRSGVR